MKDLLHHKSAGNALNALDLPLEGSIQVPLALSSDLRAWKHTRGAKLCKRSNRYPGHDMRWALVSTSGTYSPWHLDCEGLCTVVEMKCGSKWWVIASPRPGETTQDFLMRIDTFMRNFDPFEPNSEKWGCEAILLTPGTTL